MKKKKQGLVMRQVVEIARLQELGLSKSEIHRSTNISRPTIDLYLEKFQQLNLHYADIKNMPWEVLNRKLFLTKSSNKNKLQPDWEQVYEEMKKDNMTLFLVWSEFIANNKEKECVSYSRFCKYYNKYCNSKKLTMRQFHKPGEKAFIDYCGTTMQIIDPRTGEQSAAQIFVSSLGFSNYTYVCATKSQSTEEFLYANVQSFKYFGGVPKILVPDNLKAAVIKACRYDPLINPAYQDFATYYQTTVVPARARKPKDKAKVENSVLNVSRKILAPLRNEVFHSIGELNIAIRKQLEEFNSRFFQKREGSRKSVFETEEKHLLTPLPSSDFEFANWKKAKVGFDYHIELEGHYYSVPYNYVSREVEVRYSGRLVTVIKDHTIIAEHLRSYDKGKFTVLEEHMPRAHREQFKSSPETIKWHAAKIGPKTSSLITKVFEQHNIPETACRKCLGITKLSGKFEVNRVEIAAGLLLDCGIGSNPYQKMKQILEREIDLKYGNQKEATVQFSLHENVRGETYYQ